MVKKVLFIIALFVCCCATTVSAQNYVGNYSGTLAFTPVVFPLDQSLFNSQIDNQVLSFTVDSINFTNVPLLTTGDLLNFSFTNVAVAANGIITAPSVVTAYSNIALKCTIINGTVSGNTINLNMQMVDNYTNGVIANVTAVYSGTKQTSALKTEMVVADARKIIGYYSVTGQKLDNEPQNGLFIVRYNDGKSEKKLK